MASPFELQHRYGPVYLTPLNRPGSHINLEDQHIWFNFHLCGNLVVPPGPLHLRGDEWCRLAGWHRAILMRRRIDPAPAFWCLRCENAESHILSCWSPTKPILTLSTVIMDPVITTAVLLGIFTPNPNVDQGRARHSRPQSGTILRGHKKSVNKIV